MTTLEIRPVEIPLIVLQVLHKDLSLAYQRSVAMKEAAREAAEIASMAELDSFKALALVEDRIRSYQENNYIRSDLVPFLISIEHIRPLRAVPTVPPGESL